MTKEKYILLPQCIIMSITNLNHDVLLSISIKRNQLSHAAKSLSEFTAGFNNNKSEQTEVQ